MLNLMRLCLKNVPKVKIDLLAKVTHIRVPSTHLTIFSESTWPIVFKFHMKTPYDRLTKKYKLFWPHDQDGCHAHIRYKPFKYLLFWNQTANDLGT